MDITVGGFVFDCECRYRNWSTSLNIIVFCVSFYLLLVHFRLKPNFKDIHPTNHDLNNIYNFDHLFNPKSAWNAGHTIIECVNYIWKELIKTELIINFIKLSATKPKTNGKIYGSIWTGMKERVAFSIQFGVLMLNSDNMDFIYFVS